MEQEFEKLCSDAAAELDQISSSGQLEDFRIKYLGRNGQLSGLMKLLGSVAKEDRPRLGKLANLVRGELEKFFSEKSAALLKQHDHSEKPDLSLPGRQRTNGRLHPVTQCMEEICSIFASMGFSIAEGPDIELDHYNFAALNIPEHHPARDMHDTFYIGNSVLLRTHTSPMQARIMEKQPPPIRVIAPGKVYRCDSDITHTPMFQQVEGFLVDRNISFADLKGVLTVSLQKIFEKDLEVRFRPSFFPFTEPSAEVDIACVICGGDGCRVCKKTGWIEILGSGMIDPEVFKMVGYDSEIYSGFAFGLGVERIAMLKYGIDDIRLYYENDLRFLSQF